MAELMPFLVTATDARGSRDTFAREAASIEHLRTVLERDGYTDIEFIDDELSARLRTQRPEDGQPRTAAEYRYEARVRQGAGAGDAWLMAARGALPVLVLAAVAIGWGAWSGDWLWAAIAVAVVIGLALLVRRGRARAAGYEDLLRACARGERDAAAKLIDTLRDDPALSGNEQLQQDLAFRSAGLQAQAGDLAGALQAVEPLRYTPHAAGGMFESRIAGVHYLAGDMPGFLESMEAAYAASAEAQVMRLDLAFAHARVGDTARARDLLDGVDRGNLSTLHKPIAVAVQGLIARREGDEEGGELLLTDAVSGLSAFAANPAVWPLFGILVGHQALAMARSGDAAEARTALSGWEPVVDACLDAATRDALYDVLKS